MYNYASTNNPGAAPQPPTAINLTDTYNWFTSLNLKPVPDTNKTISISYLTDSSSGSIQVTIKNGILNPNDNSIPSFLTALLDMQQIPGSWNEIGHN